MAKDNFSALQKAILLLGYHYRKSGRHLTQANRLTGLLGVGWFAPADVTPGDVKFNFYGFPVNRQGLFLFKRAEVGYARYRSATSAISKSFDRLVEQGLAEKVYRGIVLTDRGINVAVSMSFKT